MVDIIKRDWPGIIATSVTFGLFGVGLYLVIDPQYAIHMQVERTQMILNELSRNRQEIMENRQRLDKLQQHLEGMHPDDGL